MPACDYALSDIEWLSPVMQGLAYAIGAERAAMPGVDLGESAIVAQFVKFLWTYRAQPNDQIVTEYALKAIGGEVESACGRPAAADVAVLRDGSPVALTEVKRWSRTWSFEQDVEKLAPLRRSAGLSAFVLVCSQDERPVTSAGAELVTENGTAIPGVLMTSGGVPYKVRRVCKAVSSLSPEATGGQWVCLVEVLDGSSA